MIEEWNRTNDLLWLTSPYIGAYIQTNIGFIRYIVSYFL